jgi:MFS family permease
MTRFLDRAVGRGRPIAIDVAIGVTVAIVLVVAVTSIAMPLAVTIILSVAGAALLGVAVAVTASTNDRRRSTGRVIVAGAGSAGAGVGVAIAIARAGGVGYAVYRGLSLDANVTSLVTDAVTVLALAGTAINIITAVSRKSHRPRTSRSWGTTWPAEQLVQLLLSPGAMLLAPARRADYLAEEAANFADEESWQGWLRRLIEQVLTMAMTAWVSWGGRRTTR